ncbi:hypothetical protein SAMN05444169_9024 [Bradyrhizobium erythrophlei]|uniref:Uncharacterized protein n=1 Tax=Bradyrhizobium erythrophlei TaxID=1437360 RepID=A0A1M5V9A9_9BRAD|nr:hypothetical protein SAMN05444169_9024 [Bradyrhizobium erythrophlei]
MALLTTVNVVEPSPEEIPHRACAMGYLSESARFHRCRRQNRDHRPASNMRPVSWSQNAHWCAVAKFVSVVGVGGTSDCIT